MKKTIIYYLIITCLCFATGCNKTNSDSVEKKKNEIKSNNKIINKDTNDNKLKVSDITRKQNVRNYADSTADNAEKAIELAKNSNRYLLLLFYNGEDKSFELMDKEIDNFINNSSNSILKYKVLTTEGKENSVIKKFGVDRAPLPVVLVLAPNGAITGGFPESVTNQQLEKSIVSELTMKILKPLQEQKIVLVSLQNKKTKFNRESTNALNDFSSDSRLRGSVDIIKEDPDNTEIKDFLKQCKLEKKITEATIVFLVPPGSIAGVFTGKITKDTLIAALSKCGSGGCGTAPCGP